MNIEKAYDLFDDQRYSEAQSICDHMLLSQPDYFPAIYLSGMISAERRDNAKAINHYKRALEIRPNSETVLFNLAFMYLKIGEDRESLDCINQYIGLISNDHEAYALRSTILMKMADLTGALEDIEKALHFAPDFVEALNNKGSCLSQLQRWEEAKMALDRAVVLKPDYVEAYSNLGNALNGLGRYDDAISAYEHAIAINPDFAEAHSNLGIALNETGRHDDAMTAHMHAISLKPSYPQAFFNLGTVFNRVKKFQEALHSFQTAISLKPDYAEAYSNLGVSLNELGRFDEAIKSYETAITLKPNFADAYNNMALILNNLKRYDEAIKSIEKILSINPDYEWGLGMLLHIKMKTADWSNIDSLIEKLKNDIRDGKKSSAPFPVLVLIDDLHLQFLAARQWIQNMYPVAQEMSSIVHKAGNQKIRIGYFSADFHNHATAHLMAELFERHDRNCFEIFAISFGPDLEDEMRLRLRKAFDHFIDVSEKSDREIADISKNLGIDIAIDLKGFTQDSRTGIFAHRCAPIQVNYIGYPGTMAASYMDYLIADPIVVPPQSKEFYHEKIIYLPNSYQVNDSMRAISDKKIKRADVGLPEDSFVFCCFNNTFKILPDVFDSWARILKNVEGSVLWLLEDNVLAKRNLQREIIKRGLSQDRLFFAKRIPLAEHLARHRCADLFLDTLPYNAHTTASDALWAGLPVLTRIGESFPARVSASLLNAVGLPELVTHSIDEYEKTAIELARHRDQLDLLKTKLAAKRFSSQLFDTSLYVKHLENAFELMYQRYKAGILPDHISVKP